MPHIILPPCAHHSITPANVVVTLKVPGQRSGTNPVPYLDLGKNLTPRTADQFKDADHSQYVFGPVSPGVQEKISSIEKQSEGSKFFNMTPLLNKRKDPEFSPDSNDLSKKERKLLKSEDKKKLKSARKQEFQANRALKSKPLSS